MSIETETEQSAAVMSESHARTSDWLERAAASFRTPKPPAAGCLRAGIDLGTATCVIVIIDESGEAVWIDSEPTAAVRDGVIVDFRMATAAASRLREGAEEALGKELITVATAYPPGVPEADAKACQFVLESAGFDDVRLLDEVSAAQAAIAIESGIVVDVGGGSTGVGVFENGELVSLDDRAGGGHHLDLILSGALHVDLGEAERMKREAPLDTFTSILRPGYERIARTVVDLTVDYAELPVHLVGGALMAPGAKEAVAAWSNRTVVSYPHANLITPLGIAMSA